MSKEKLTLKSLITEIDEEFDCYYAKENYCDDEHYDKLESLIKSYARQCCDKDREEMKDIYSNLKHSWLSKKPYPKEIE